MRHNSKKSLFSRDSLRDYLNSISERAKNEVDTHNPEDFLKQSIHDLEGYYYEKHKIEPIELHEDHIVQDVSDTKIDVSNDTRRYIRNRSKPFYIPGTEVKIEIPFSGNEDILYLRASKFSMSPPQAIVRGNKLIFQKEGEDLDGEEVRKSFNRWLNDIKKYLGYSANDISGWHQTLEKEIKSKIKHRRDKLLEDRKLESSIGFPLKERKESNTYTTSEIKRKRIKPHLPKTDKKAYEPEPTIKSSDYEHILDLINKTATMLEWSPSSFKNMDEEGLRDMFLVPMNSHFEGQATGETFNAEGKTDILIREKNKCLFIAECKVWRGKKYLLEAIDQLLGYTTWRDTKTAILIFNRNKDFSAVLEKIPGIVKEHPGFKKELDCKLENGFKYVVAKESDKSRDIYLTVLAFDVPS
ncbi:hypothetical protein [Fodinibius salsisoli]|uniref:Restriction endonuclease type IV Mrr domain-containing protein n=1 Tax=Fodinibius salsisoli TaxID=2820877 RepID=A0ABT3PR29_9BACT|nr:hypothetical protein [Fodinibius salsisoli]MCW9708318.1 hypothetical protein [Fodinibius salsisoli]